MPVYRRFLSRDPTTFLAAFALWALCSGITLVLPGDIFAINPGFAALRALGIPENAWGAAMLSDSAGIFLSLFFPNGGLRFAMAMASGPLWIFLGVELVIGGARAGFFSAPGAWDVAAGLGCLLAAVQWLGQERGA